MNGLTALTLGVLTDCVPHQDSGRLQWPESAYPHLSHVVPPDVTVVWFHPLDIDAAQHRVFGWQYIHAENRWRKTHSELPRVIYNRIARRHTERLGAFGRLFCHLKRRSVIFNPRFLDKSEVHFALSNSRLADHWPQTFVCTRVQDAPAILKELGDAYLKPVEGSLGRGIVRIVRERGRFCYWRCLDDDTRPVYGKLPDSALTTALLSWFRKSAFLIQATVPRSTYQGQPFDLRVLMQKNPLDTWQMTGVAGRVATDGGVTTHANRGGAKVSFEQLREHVGQLPLKRDIASLCSHALEALTDYTELDLFEASLDLAIDETGHPYVLEINSKPFPFDEKDIQQEAARSLLRYAAAKLQSSNI